MNQEQVANYHGPHRPYHHSKTIALRLMTRRLPGDIWTARLQLLGGSTSSLSLEVLRNAINCLPDNYWYLWHRLSLILVIDRKQGVQCECCGIFSRREHGTHHVSTEEVSNATNRHYSTSNSKRVCKPLVKRGSESVSIQS